MPRRKTPHAHASAATGAITARRGNERATLSTGCSSEAKADTETTARRAEPLRHRQVVLLAPAVSVQQHQRAAHQGLRLTHGRSAGMEWAMQAVMISCALAALAMPSRGQAPAAPSTSLENAEVIADPVPPELTKSAVEAVGKLGDEVVLGRYQAAIDRMNPLWKKRTAERLGGMEVLEKQLKSVAAEMVRQGVSMISFKPQGQPKVFQVWPGTNTAGGQAKLVYTKWMILVPTVTRFRITPQGAAKPVIIESTGFQVAVREKSGGEWTFIDGANLKPADLRSLFPTLPADIDLPPVEKKQVF